MNPIFDYLQNDILQENKEETQRIKAMSARFILVQGKIYSRSFSGPYLMCIEPSHAKYILSKLYEGECSNHSRGRSLAHKAITIGYY